MLSKDNGIEGVFKWVIAFTYTTKFHIPLHNFNIAVYISHFIASHQ